MLAPPPAISVPFNPLIRSDSPAISTPQELSAPPRFPHTRAQLTAIARQYRPLDNYDDDNEDGSSRITSALVARVASLLESEREEDIKNLLKDSFGPNIEDDELSQHVLDLMHRHRDDVDNVPFLFLTPTRRPISRPSSRASSHSTRLIARPDTPTSAPSSPLAMVFRRPHTPLMSPLAQGGQQGSSYINARSDSPGQSPVIPHAQFASSLPASPLSSPRILNAKAHEFKPIPRPLSSASSNPGSLASLRAETPSPDLWAHNPLRPTSKLAIAAPLTPESALLPRSGTPSSLRLSLRPGEDDDEDDPFDPFGQKALPRSFHSIDNDAPLPWSNSPLSNSSISASTDDARYGYYADDGEHSQLFAPGTMLSHDLDPETAALLTDGMTPLDVLSMVFGSTLAPSELEDALEQNGYDFDRAMSWLVDRQIATMAASNAGGAAAPRGQIMSGRVSIIGRDASYFRGRGQQHPGGFRGQRFNGRPVPGGNRVCRYFLAGECLRADCRFSHDLERALCRFWLRGTCAKGEACEFLHRLPEGVDPNNLPSAMQRVDLNGRNGDNRSPPPEEFPALNHTMNATPKKGRGGGYAHARDDSNGHDPNRARFAAVVKKSGSPGVIPVMRPTSRPSSPSNHKDPATVAARREALGSVADLDKTSTIIAPRASSRIKLRPCTLLPTLPDGDAVQNLYMAYRSRAQQLGATRNACLARAAEAWKKGDGTAAKQFSREGHDLNAKMSAEMVQAAGRLVRERAKLTEQAVRARDAVWSDDYNTPNGKIVGAGLGVCLGVASQTQVGDGKKLSPEERTEVMLDLHGLHATEATEVVEEFLLALEREHFSGLAYLVVDEEKHAGNVTPTGAAAGARLATGVREWLHLWGYPWSEREGIICVDALTHS